jgi:hypothetical protein
MTDEATIKTESALGLVTHLTLKAAKVAKQSSAG